MHVCCRISTPFCTILGWRLNLTRYADAQCNVGALSACDGLIFYLMQTSDIASYGHIQALKGRALIAEDAHKRTALADGVTRQ